MRGEAIYKILNFIEDRSMEVSDLVVAILGSGYGASMAKIDRNYDSKQRSRQNEIIAREQKRYLQKYLSKLKASGFIKENDQNKIILSVRGKDKLKS